MFHSTVRTPLSPPISPHMLGTWEKPFEYLQQDRMVTGGLGAYGLVPRPVETDLDGFPLDQYATPGSLQQRHGGVPDGYSHPHEVPQNQLSPASNPPALQEADTCGQCHDPWSGPVLGSVTTSHSTSGLLTSAGTRISSYRSGTGPYEAQHGEGRRNNGNRNREEGSLEMTAAELRAHKRKMKRFRLTNQQTRFLLNELSKQPHPDAAHRERLSRAIPGFTPRQVQVWFQNRRAKLKPLMKIDQERMMRSRALPENFDITRSMLSPQTRQVPSSSLAVPSNYAVYGAASAARSVSLDNTIGSSNHGRYTQHYAYTSPINPEPVSTGSCAQPYAVASIPTNSCAPASAVLYSHSQPSPAHSIHTTTYVGQPNQITPSSYPPHNKWTLPSSGPPESPLRTSMAYADPQTSSVNFWTTSLY